MAEPQGFEETVIQSILSQLDSMEDGVAGQMGLGPETVRYSRQQQIEEWTFSPYPDPQERMNRAVLLHMQGATQEQITDDLYPKLRRLVTTGRTRSEEQEKYAREMRRLVGWPDDVPVIDGALDIPGMAPMLPPEPPPLVQPPAAVPVQDVAPLPDPGPVPTPPPMPAQGMARPFNPLTGMMGG